jgi:hypothetical protein
MLTYDTPALRQTGSRNLTGLKKITNYWHLNFLLLIAPTSMQESDIWSQASYMYAILWEAFLDPSDLWILWPNIRFLPSIVAEKNVTKNGHIQNVCSMCIKINKVGKQEVGIWRVVLIFYSYKSQNRRRGHRSRMVVIPPLPEGGGGMLFCVYPSVIHIWSLRPNIRFLSSIVA